MYGREEDAHYPSCGNRPHFASIGVTNQCRTAYGEHETPSVFPKRLCKTTERSCKPTGAAWCRARISSIRNRFMIVSFQAWACRLPSLVSMAYTARTTCSSSAPSVIKLSIPAVRTSTCSAAITSRMASSCVMLSQGQDISEGSVRFVEGAAGKRLLDGQRQCQRGRGPIVAC
jgi:hypothetical protein